VTTRPADSEVTPSHYVGHRGRNAHASMLKPGCASQRDQHCVRHPIVSSLPCVQALAEAEAQVLRAVASARGRGKEGVDEEQRALLDEAVQQLESDGGVSGPTAREDLLDSRHASCASVGCVLANL
jgi:hypothetical protein